jgi:hypothetical protein
VSVQPVGQHLRARGHGFEQRRHVEPPRAALHLQRQALDLGTEDRRLRCEVGPDRHDDDDLIASTRQRLHRQHQRVHAG